MNDDFKNLLKLLDDDNEQLAGIAMAELINRSDSRLDRILRALQETPDPKLRKRIRQLQSAIFTRRKRQLFAREFITGDLSLSDAMLHLHLLWFDNDTLEEISEQWNSFLRSTGEWSDPENLERLLLRLTKTIQFYTDSGEPENPEALCIGTILEEGLATDFMGCIVAKLAAKYWNFETEILSCDRDFYLLYNGNVYDPRKRWHQLSRKSLREKVFRKWNDKELISILSYSLFTDAVATDSFRYIHTLGSCVGKQPNLNFLPYPYGTDSLGNGSVQEKRNDRSPEEC